MTFANEKRTFLAKSDKSKKGSVDRKCLPFLEYFNTHDAYYTTSSCSGRIYFWRGTGKKNQTEWLRVSHEPIDEEFLKIEEDGLVWLRCEPFILHVACATMEHAIALLDAARTVYKKSCLLSIRNKIIVEMRGSEVVEMPYSLNGVLLFSGSREWLVNILNGKMAHNVVQMNKVLKIIKKI